MSPKKVRQHIRRMKRQRRREERDLKRQQQAAKSDQAVKANQAEQVDKTEQPDQSVQPSEAHQLSQQVESNLSEESSQAQPVVADVPQNGPTLKRRGRRALPPVLIGAGLVFGVVISSVVQPHAAEDAPSAQMAGWQAAAAPEAVEVVCPPMPGVPDSLSQSGVISYEEADDAAESSVTGFFAAEQALVTPLRSSGTGDQRERTEPLNETNLIAASSLRVPYADEDEAEIDSPFAAATRSFFADQGPVTGFANGACLPVQAQHLMLGAETGSGALSLLTVSNPAERPATVEVTSIGPDGEQDASSSVTLLVPEESSRSINVASLQSEEQPLALNIEASGAPVGAAVQSSRTPGNSGAGVEILTGAEAATEHVIPAVLAGAEEDPELWLYAPEDGEVTVELQIFDSEGQVEADVPGVFTIDGGQVHAVALEGLETGAHSVTVRTDAPSYAAVRSTGDGEEVTEETQTTDPITGQESTEETTAAPAPDVSWSRSAPVIPGAAVMLPHVEGNVEHELHLMADGVDESTATVELALLDSSGNPGDQTASFEVGSDAATVLSNQNLADLADDNGWDLEDVPAVSVLSAQGRAHAAVLSRAEGGEFTVTPLSPPLDPAPVVDVYVQR